jgi:hydrogenase small subunit
MRAFYQAKNDELDAPFVFVIEGSIPNENISGDGYWTSLGFDHSTGQPITLNQWIDWLAPKAWAVVAAGTCATYGGIHAMAGNPTGCMGLADYLGWDFRSVAGIPIVNVPGCPVQPDVAAVPGGRTLAHDPTRRPAPADVAVREDGA